MLVLSRKVGEEIVIGDTIRVKVVAVDGGKVRIGIIAPKDVIVDRQEVHEKRLHTNEWADHTTRQPLAVTMPSFICKELSKLPPIVGEWQSFKQPQCLYYCNGECRGSGRQSATAPCPLDSTELLLGSNP
jgi:carbon storage regulator